MRWRLVGDKRRRKGNGGAEVGRQLAVRRAVCVTSCVCPGNSSHPPFTGPVVQLRVAANSRVLGASRAPKTLPYSVLAAGIMVVRSAKVAVGCWNGRRELRGEESGE